MDTKEYLKLLEERIAQYNEEIEEVMEKVVKYEER